MHLYKYETHAHTSETSKCSKLSGAELVRFYKELGYTGLFISDHFFNGNTTVPKDLPWAERVKLFCKGYDNAYEEGKRVGLNVFFAWEYTFNGTDLLTYGLDKEWLLSYPLLLNLDVNEYCDLVHQDGGFIAHAHPFREAGYIPMIRLFPRKVDAVEVINASMPDEVNARASFYSESYNLLKIAGSDTHFANKPCLSGLQLKRRLNSTEDMTNAIKSGEAEIFTDIYFSGYHF